MSKKVRVGIVGTSWWSDLMYLPSLKSHPEAELVALCGRNLERAKEMAEKYGVKNIYSNYQEMLEQARLDAIVIGAPDDLHYPMTMAALDAGLHVLCDKPLALNAKDAEAMYQKAAAKGTKHMVLFTNRWLPWCLGFKTKIDEGYLGQFHHCSFHYISSHAKEDSYSWRFDARRANGVLGDFGPHIIDLAHWYIGKIRRVNAQLKSFIEQKDELGKPIPSANDYAQLMLEFDNGSQGIIELSAGAHTGDRLQSMHFEAIGSEGTLELDLKFLGLEACATVRGCREAGKAFEQIALDLPTSSLDVTDNYLATFNQTSAGPRAFIDAILELGPASPSFYDGLLAQKVIEAAKISAEAQNWVVVS